MWPGPRQIRRPASPDRSPSSTVAARSAAEMPVRRAAAAPRSARRTPSRTASVFCDTISGISSSSSRSGVIDRQIRPRPYRAMKLIASGVTFSAAIVRSPSFSRSSSSTTMIILPARMASTASSMRANGERLLARALGDGVCASFSCCRLLSVCDFTRPGVSVSPASSAARTTYLPTMSHSRFTRSRTCDAAQVRVLPS